LARLPKGMIETMQSNIRIESGADDLPVRLKQTFENRWR
jgi:hypothetical protein